jgi:hypothetical protein
MINLNNYAILAEQKKYGYSTPITESIDAVNEAAPDMQTEDGVKKVLGGKTDPNYATQWNQLVDDAATRKDAGTYTVTIIHDNQKPMVTLQYQIGADLKPVKGSVQLAASSGATGKEVSIQQIAKYDPKGKMNEFVAALITVSIEKFGKSWTKAHIDWVNSQINLCKALGSFYGNLGTFADGNFLKDTGDIFTNWINGLWGGDRPSQIDAISKTNKIAGSAATDAQVNMILQTINVKLQESIIQKTDEKAIHGLYMLISPKYTAGQIVTMYQAITGTSGGLLTTMKTRGATDSLDSNYKRLFIQWCVGVRGEQYATEILSDYRFDLASYKASLAQIKASLV